MISPDSQRITPPRQSRSRRTLERIVAASMELLATEGPEGLTVHKVVAKADSSVGSFYARFRGKADLLDYLSDRIWAEALERWTEQLSSVDWDAFTFSEITEGAAGLLVDAQRSRSAYLKALDRMASRRGRAYERFQAEVLRGLGDVLLRRRQEITRDDPALAVRLGLRAVLGVVEAEFRVVEDRLPREVLVEECRSLLMAYLTGEAGAAGTGSVEFFDVWG